MKQGFIKMAILRDIPYQQKFYWKGNKYKQIIRPKKPQGKFTIICSLDNDPFAEWVSMPGGRVIKPVKRVAICQS